MTKLSPNVIKEADSFSLSVGWQPDRLTPPFQPGDSNARRRESREISGSSLPEQAKTCFMQLNAEGENNLGVHAWLPAEINLVVDSRSIHHHVQPGAWEERSWIYPSDHEADNHQSQITARQLLQEAEKRAAEMLRHAENQASAITAQARAEGLAAAEAESARLLRLAHTIAEEVHAWRESMFAQTETAILSLVGEIAKTIFGPGLVLDGKIMKEALERALADAKYLGDLAIHLHPEDVARLETQWLEVEASSSGRRIGLVQDPTIRRGGCLIEGQFGQIDARVETQLKKVMDTLSESLISKPADEDITGLDGAYLASPLATTGQAGAAG
jgi:flagellar assembly protein FliH